MTREAHGGRRGAVGCGGAGLALLGYCVSLGGLLTNGQNSSHQPSTQVQAELRFTYDSSQ
jgi:hypothetical protein